MTINHVNSLTSPVGMTSRQEAPLNDAYGRIPRVAYTPRIVVKTAAYTVKAEESGTKFFTTGATAAVVFTLPAISEGPWEFEFYNLADVDMTVTAGTADTMIGFNDLDLDSIGLATSSEKIGGGIKALCDGTSLVVATMPGDPRYQTYTLTD